MKRSFSDRFPGAWPRLFDVVRLMWTHRDRESRGDVDRVPVLRHGLPPVSVADTALTWVGHATYLIRMSGITLLTDPVWSSWILGVPRRITPPGVAFSDLPPIDVVLISHNHYDHLDSPTVRRLPRSTLMLVPAGLGAWFRKRGFTDVVEFEWWEGFRAVGLTFDFVPAQHWSRRGLWDSCRSLWGGWVITGPDGHRLYHAGDSGYGPHFSEIGDRYPGIDVAMVPIGAYTPRWFMRLVHMDPEEAVRAVRDLGARRLASMHWGTFALTREPPMEPLTLLRKAWFEAGQDPSQLWDFAIGETRTLSET